MLEKSLENIREINSILHGQFAYDEILSPICCKLSDILNAGVVVCNFKGKILVKELLENSPLFFSTLDSQTIQKLNSITKTKDNLDMSGFYVGSNIDNYHYKLTIIPILFNFERLATILVYRKSTAFSVSEIVLLEAATSIFTLLLGNVYLKETEEVKRDIQNVKCVLNNLSYTELDAIIHIMDDLKENEGLIIASKVADKFKITKSVIVNAIRKLQSAGVLESRSLGMKGTYIKVLNPFFVREINKLRN